MLIFIILILKLRFYKHVSCYKKASWCIIRYHVLSYGKIPYDSANKGKSPTNRKLKKRVVISKKNSSILLSVFNVELVCVYAEQVLFNRLNRYMRVNHVAYIKVYHTCCYYNWYMQRSSLKRILCLKSFFLVTRVFLLLSRRVSSSRQAKNINRTVLRFRLIWINLWKFDEFLIIFKI